MTRTTDAFEPGGANLLAFNILCTSLQIAKVARASHRISQTLRLSYVGHLLT